MIRRANKNEKNIPLSKELSSTLRNFIFEVLTSFAEQVNKLQNDDLKYTQCHPECSEGPQAASFQKTGKW